MGVCCIVFDIDGMLFEFFMNFLNIKYLQYFMFSSCFMLFLTLKKKWCYKKICRGGVDNFFFRKLSLISFSFMLFFSTLKKILKSAPSLTG